MAMVLKCKMCGGDLVLTPGSTIAECEYCGTTQTVPSADNEKKLALFERANRHRAAGEFDKAELVYESIVADFPEEAEGYWGLVLCRYGIEYVDDPATGKKVPTCHRSSFQSILDDKDFAQAIDYADALSRKVYREEARAIENIRAKILEISSKEESYDVFICYKETDAKGERTVDSVLAQDIYKELTSAGFRVFFARITLEDKLGQEYEPYIFAALNSAKVMLAIGTDFEHYNAVWVKNEWSRYLKLMEQDSSKHLIPCYKDIDAYDMPKEFRALQGQDLGKIGAMQDLTRGVEKLINAKKAAPAVAAGMTEQEKTMVDFMMKSQKRTRALLLSVVFGALLGVVAFFMPMMGEESIFDIMFFQQDGSRVYFVGSPAMLLPPVIYGANGVGLALNCTHGGKHKGAHWVYLVYYCISVAFLSLFAAFGSYPGILLAFPLVYNGIAATVTALRVYQHKKAAKIVHCAIIGVLLVVFLLTLI